MEYISGLHALNLPCSLQTSGDWHSYSLSWEAPPLQNTQDSLYQDYGIEQHTSLRGRQGTYFVANHIRACLDLLAAGDFSNARGMRDDYICTDIYDDEIFQQVWRLHSAPHWHDIDRFMEREYRMKWVHFRERNAHKAPYDDGAPPRKIKATCRSRTILREDSIQRRNRHFCCTREE